MATPPEQWKHSHNELHHTYTNIVGKDNDLGYGIMRVDEDQRWHPMHLGQPLWNFINACFFEYGIAAYDLELGADDQEEATKDPEFQRRAKDVLTQDPQAGHQGLRRPPGAVAPDRLVPAHPGRELHRQRGPQPVVALGDHVRPLPRGRRDLREDARSTDETKGEWYVRQMLGSANISGSKAHAPHDRQPVATRSSTTCSPTCRATGTPRSRRRCRHLFEKYDLNYHTAPAAAAGLLRLAQGGPALAAQRLARDHQRQQPPAAAQAALRHGHRRPQGPPRRPGPPAAAGPQARRGLVVVPREVVNAV